MGAGAPRVERQDRRLRGNGYAGYASLAAAAEVPVDAAAVSSPFSTDEIPFRGGARRLECPCPVAAGRRLLLTLHAY
jgi:hypothetical protein